MREIKFRGKSIYNNKWLYGDLIQYESGEMSILNKFTKYGYEASEIYLRDKVNPLTIGQYTGLKDINGVEIYEGDVFSQDGYGNLVVSYARGGFIITNYDVEDREKSLFYESLSELQNVSWMYESLTLIGNIHDKEDTNGNS